jgi:hypothetical protein
VGIPYFGLVAWDRPGGHVASASHPRFPGLVTTTTTY